MNKNTNDDHLTAAAEFGVGIDKNHGIQPPNLWVGIENKGKAATTEQPASKGMELPALVGHVELTIANLGRLWGHSRRIVNGKWKAAARRKENPTNQVHPQKATHINQTSAEPTKIIILNMNPILIKVKIKTNPVIKVRGYVGNG